MDKPESVTVKILHWRDYNPRTDVRTPSWFRLDYRIANSEQFFDFSHEEFRAWIVILSLACKNNTDTLRLSYWYVTSTSRVSREGLDGAIKRLSEIEALEIIDTSTLRKRDENVTDANATEQNRTEQKKILEDTERSQSELFGAISEFATDPEIETLLKCVRKTTQARWLKLYPLDWLNREMLKAITWLEDNPAKRPRKSPSRFLGGWFARGWESHRKSIPSKKKDEINTTPIDIGV